MAKDGLLQLKGVRIEKRLKRAFNMVTVIAAVATIIGYEDQDLIDSLVERHDMRRESTYERLAAIEETMVTPEGRAAYEEIADISKELSDNVTVQVEAVEQANAGINKISEVVESISATAQEAFATSEELSAQATCMDELVARFQLRD